MTPLKREVIRSDEQPTPQQIVRMTKRNLAKAERAGEASDRRVALTLFVWSLLAILLNGAHLLGVLH